MKMLDFGDVRSTLAQCIEPPELTQVPKLALTLALELNRHITSL